MCFSDLVALRQRFEAIRRAELQRLEPKMATLSPDARARIDEITRLIVEKLLLTPTEQLKSVSDPEMVGTYSEALTRLFGLEQRAGASSADSSASAPADDRRERQFLVAQPWSRGTVPPYGLGMSSASRLAEAGSAAQVAR